MTEHHTNDTTSDTTMTECMECGHFDETRYFKGAKCPQCGSRDTDTARQEAAKRVQRAHGNQEV